MVGRLLAVSAIAVVGCFDPDLSSTEILCPDGLCPAGLACTSEGVCRATEEPDDPDGCIDQDLGSAVGRAVATGVTDGAGDDFNGCETGGSPDLAFAWTAPSSRRFRFSTCGSAYDSVLIVEESCTRDSDRLACDDDGCQEDCEECELQSRVELDLEAGDSIVIVVAGFEGEDGDFVLHIEPDAGQARSCPQLP